ncbi:helix-turn-helix transcriptional regulator [bacterium]|nr:helix-turn-helix transcriptional regulator [bacterium]
MKTTETEKGRPLLTGLLIRKKRKENGWTQGMLATRIQDITNIPITKHAISKWERQGKYEIEAHYWNINALYRLFFSNHNKSFDLFTSLIKQYSHIDSKDRITGRYSSNWGFDGENNPEIIEFSLNGEIIVGKIISGEIDYELYGFLFTNKVLSGYWINKNDGHHGTVMLEFNYSYNRAVGNWIGTFDRDKKNDSENFKYGYWRLEKIPISSSQ